MVCSGLYWMEPVPYLIEISTGSSSNQVVDESYSSTLALT